MEIILEILLTAFITLLFSFLIAKIVSLAMGGTDSVSGVEENENPLIDAAAADEIIMEELEFAEKLKVQVFESEKKVEFVKECADKVDVFETEQSGVDQGFESEKKVECVQEAADKIDELELEAGELGGVDEVVERLEFQGFEIEKEAEFLQETAEVIEDFEAEQAKLGEAEVEVKLDDIVGEIGEELDAENETKLQSEEISVEESQVKGLGEEEKEGDDDDDWEGIERSELEKVFADAAKFVENIGDLEGMGNDVQMELYGLHKIATEGPCREPQPLAFMVSSRSKWNSWQRLGNMNPDAAMEQYVALVSDKIPGWMEENSAGDHRFESADPGIPGSVAPDIKSNPDQQNFCTRERNADLKSAAGSDITGSTSFENQAKD